VTKATSIQVHATCVAIDGAGILLRGPSGAGKSDLALRLVDGGAALVADDRVDLRRRGTCLVASPPAPLRGLVEARGVGILRLPFLDAAELRLVVDLVARDEVERLPGPESEAVLGIVLPRLRLHGFDASAPAKLALALRHGVAIPAASGRSAA
jgi:serine kinase of HPr protein (carbohydrate metabolism regulator)